MAHLVLCNTVKCSMVVDQTDYSISSMYCIVYIIILAILKSGFPPPLHAMLNMIIIIAYRVGGPLG